jgi:hypothetical protein
MRPFCKPCATARAPFVRYRSTSVAPTKERALAMKAHVMREGRLLGLTRSIWAVLSVGMTLCAALTSLF